MKSQKLLLALSLLLSTATTARAAEEGELCWEKCFRGAFGTENNRFRDIYTDVLRVVLDIKAIMNLHNLTKVGYLIDSSISKWNDPAFNPDIGNTGFRSHTSDYIFYFEYILAHVLLFAVDGAAYFVQFDENSAWGCEGVQCYPNNCNLTRAIRWMTPIKTSPSSHCPNNMEAGCNLMGFHMSTLNCTKAANPGEKGLLVAIINSDFDSLIDPMIGHLDPICPRFPHHGHHGVSSCEQYFDHRYVIGVHEAKEENIKKFVSHPNNYRMLPENIFTYGAVKALYNCVNLSGSRPCCPPGSGTFTLNPTKCDQTQGPFGAAVVDYPTYPALINVNRFLPLPF